jgi:hypothetical protein
MSSKETNDLMSGYEEEELKEGKRRVIKKAGRDVLES